MTVTLVLHACFRIGCLLLGLGAILVAELVNQIPCEIATLDVNLDFPTVIPIEYLIDELSTGNLWRLLTQQLHLRISAPDKRP